MPRTAAPRRNQGVSTLAPTTELGTIMQGVFSMEGMAPWRNFIDDQEYVPELVWPRSVRTYEEVRADAQVSALLKGTFLPLRKRGNWVIDPNGIDDNSRVERLAQNLNLPIQGEPVKKPKRRMRGRFQFNEHLRLACLGPIFGHYYFEQSGFIDKDGYWTLKRLAERPPRTIADFRIDPQDGGLVSLIQNVSQTGIAPRQQNVLGPFPEIPIDRLVGYVWDKEGANWAGRSILRDLYKYYVLKDRGLRIDMINHERAGGVPYIEAQPDASSGDIARLSMMAQNFRVGDSSGGAVPFGAKVQIARGAGSKVVDSLQYLDEGMARNFLLMVMALGTSRSGSRNLGSTFTEFWSEGVNAIGDWICDTFNEYMIEDYWDWNYGEDDDTVPLLTYESDPELNATDIAQLIKVGAILVDDELEDQLRKEFGLVNRGKPRPNQILLPTADIDPNLGETPDGSGSSATQQSNKEEGGQQLSQDEKQLAQSQGKNPTQPKASRASGDDDGVGLVAAPSLPAPAVVLVKKGE